MADGDIVSSSDQHELLKQILSTVQSIRKDYQHLSAAVECIQRQVNVLSNVKQVHDTPGESRLLQTRLVSAQLSATGYEEVASDTESVPNAQTSLLGLGSAESNGARGDRESLFERKNSAAGTSRIILTTYPGQSGIDPLIMNWGHVDALQRGPVVVSRSQSTVRRRNGKRG